MATNHKSIKSTRGNQMLIVDDFCFKKDSVRKSKVYYKCRQCLDGCKSRAILNNKCITITGKPHNHESNIGYIINLETKNAMVNAINNNPSKPIIRSYNDETAKKREELKVNYSLTLITSSLPTFQQLSSSAYKVRSQHIPIGPQSREDLI